jgi:hypothetical protein
MMPHELKFIVPRAPQQEILEAYRVGSEFYREVEYRQARDRYCEWYRRTAQSHQQELEAMRRDINILGWFRRNSY